MNWTSEDFRNGLCAVAEVGTPRPEPVVVVDPLPPPIDDAVMPPSLRAQLTKDALAAYRDLGGVEYLKKNPALLDKVLARSIAPEPVSIVNNQVAQVFPDWLRPKRLSYQLSSEVVSDIESVGPAAELRANWIAALAEDVEANPSDHAARAALDRARAASTGVPLLAPPDPE